MNFQRISFILFLLIFFSINSSSQWVPLNSGTTMNINEIRFINSQTGFFVGAGSAFRKTTDGGNTWIALDPFSAIELRSVYFFNSNTGLISGGSGLIIKTTDGGYNFSTISTGTSNPLYGLSFYNNQAGVCAGASGTILFTTNGGDNWAIGNPTGYLVSFYSSFMANAATGYCVGVNTIFSPLFAKTTNGGANWTYSSFMVNNNEATLYDVHFFDIQNGVVVANLWNGQGGISLTTNGGLNWTSQIFTYGLFGLDFPTTLIGYCNGFNGCILKSTDGGITWTQQTSGTSLNLRTIDFVDSLVGYAAGSSGTILKTTNGGLSGLKPVSKSIPGKFILYQNYPNPFNPSTKIKFSIPPSPSKMERGSGGEVKLIIYDLLGREVTIIVNEKLNPGTYEIEWDGSNYQSGIYFVKLIAGNYTESKKLILLK